MRDPFILVTPLDSALPQNVIFADALEGRADSIYYYSSGGELHAIPEPGWIMRTQRYQCSVLTSALSVQVFPVNKPERRSHAGYSDEEEHEGRINGSNGNAGCARGEDSRGQDEEIVQGDKTQTSMAVPSGKKSSRCAAGMSRHVACRMTSRDSPVVFPNRQSLIPSIHKCRIALYSSNSYWIGPCLDSLPLAFRINPTRPIRLIFATKSPICNVILCLNPQWV